MTMSLNVNGSISLVDRTECPICGSHAHAVHVAFDEIPVVKCDDCEFMWSSKVIAEQEQKTYYEQKFGGQRPMRGQFVNARVNSWAIQKLANLSEIKTVLDVGAGYGFFLDALRRRFGFEVTGIEPSRQEADFAKNSLGLNVVNLPLAESGLEAGSYDLVTSFEVIEHVSRPVDFIREMAALVKPEGHLLIMTDNFDSRMARVLGAAFPKWIPHSHISHFSPATLKIAAHNTGDLALVKSMSYTPWDVLLRAAYYRLRGIRKEPSEAFNLSSELETEMVRSYRLFWLRRTINRLWAKTTLSSRMDGDLMYCLFKKRQ
jgi:2-polyprenyl-3-methyl-5-hydroxy-6-metoxy-1,4-benzoquinol methylase